MINDILKQGKLTKTAVKSVNSWLFLAITPIFFYSFYFGRQGQTYAF